MFDSTPTQQQGQSFLLRLTPDAANADWQLLLKPIDGGERFLFADVASFVDALSAMTMRYNGTAPQPDQTERRIQ